MSRKAKPKALSRAALKVRVQDRASYATFLAEDGAFLSAARVLRSLADECETHQLAINRQLEEAMGRPLT